MFGCTYDQLHIYGVTMYKVLSLGPVCSGRKITLSFMYVHWKSWKEDGNGKGEGTRQRNRFVHIQYNWKHLLPFQFWDNQWQLHALTSHNTVFCEAKALLTTRNAGTPLHQHAVLTQPEREGFISDSTRLTTGSSPPRTCYRFAVVSSLPRVYL
jgi:hypothetical protein